MSNALQIGLTSITPELELTSYLPQLGKLAEAENRFYTKVVDQNVAKINIYTQNSLDRYKEKALKADENFEITGPESLSLGWLTATKSYTFEHNVNATRVTIKSGTSSSGYNVLCFDSIEDKNEYMNTLVSNMTLLTDKKELTFEDSEMKSKLMFDKLKLDNLEVLPVSVRVNTRDEVSLADLKSTKEVPNMQELADELTFLKSTGRTIMMLDLNGTKTKSDYVVATNIDSFSKGSIECHDETIYIKTFRRSETTMDKLVDSINLTFKSGKDSYEYMNEITKSNVLELKFV